MRKTPLLNNIIPVKELNARGSSKTAGGDCVGPSPCFLARRDRVLPGNRAGTRVAATDHQMPPAMAPEGLV